MSVRTPQTKTIKSDHGDDVRYTVIAHPAEEGIELLPVILRFLGSGVAPLVDAFSGVESEDGALSLENAELNGEAIGSALNGLAKEIAAGGASLCKQVLKHTTVSRPGGGEAKVPLVFSSQYQANYGELVLALVFALDVNFGPCLRARFGGGNMSALTGLLGKLNES